jgi:hypothetical protein
MDEAACTIKPAATEALNTHTTAAAAWHSSRTSCLPTQSTPARLSAMAASRTTLLLLGLVVLATVLAGAEANNTSYPGLSKIKSLVAELKVDATKCGSPLKVLWGDVFKAADKAKALKLIPGGKVTELDAVELLLKKAGVVPVLVQVLSKDGKVVVAKVAFNVELVNVVVALVNKVYVLLFEVVADLEHKQLVFLSGGKKLCVLDLTVELVLRLGLKL